MRLQRPLVIQVLGADENMRIATLSSAVVLAALVGNAMGEFGGGSPTILHPAPVLLVIPAFMGVPVSLLTVIFAVVFLVWTPGFLVDAVAEVTPFPKRSWLLLALTAGVSLLAFVSGWDYGVKYESYSYTVVCAGLSALLGLAAVALAVFAARTRRASASLAAQFVIFCWLGTYAVPYLGETP